MPTGCGPGTRRRAPCRRVRGVYLRGRCRKFARSPFGGGTSGPANVNGERGTDSLAPIFGSSGGPALPRGDRRQLVEPGLFLRVRHQRHVETVPRDLDEFPAAETALVDQRDVFVVDPVAE